jgi:LuxR family transcriptional regulator, maltose regulon positive regulatory protein
MTRTMSRPEASHQGRAKERTQFLEDKLQIPPSHFPVLPRRRVTGLIEQATRHRVTLLCGPAGAGKTVACATWAATNPDRRRVVWLTLDTGDQNCWFWAYVCAGLTRLRVAPRDALRSLEDSSPEQFPLRLVEAAQLLTEPVTLVLDGVDELTDQAVLAGLDLLIRHAPGTLRLVLSARQPPALQLARLRVSGELADIGGRDLACTSDEADAYFAMLGLDVDQAARDELLRRTEGWMAGLRLAAMRARAGPGPGTMITDLAADEPMVTDYLWDEVLGRPPAETRMFLLRTSITEEVSVDLADALTGQSGSARTLDRLNRENSFVDALDRERGCYRYHPLLREVLTAGRHREIPDEIPVLLGRAARWHAAHGRPIAAVRYAAEAADWDYAGQILAAAGVAAALQDQAAELEAVLILFPAERSTDDPAVAAAWAATRLWHGDREGAASYLDSARHAAARAAPAMRRIMEPTIAALRVMHAASRADADPGLLAEGRALAGRCQAAVSTRAEHGGVGLLWFALGTASLRRWEIQDARRALRRADRELGAGGLAEWQARARGWRALAEALGGDLAAAERSAAGHEASLAARLARAQISLSRDDLAAARRLLDDLALDDPGLDHVGGERGGAFPGEPSVSVLAALIRARVMLADGDAAGARQALARLRECRGPAGPALSDVITVAEGELALGAGDVGRARAILALAGESGPAGRAGAGLLRGAVLIAEGDFPAALAALPGLGAALAHPTGLTRHEQISSLLLAAIAHRRLGSAGEAAGLVQRALTLAEPDGAYRVFLDLGAPVRSALAAGAPPASRHARFAGRILERFEAQAPPPPAERPSVPLTSSEQAVLCFLPSHMTNEEISQALFLSVNTVKTHLRSAYRKLGVGSRREAIARGRRIGLL